MKIGTIYRVISPSQRSYIGKTFDDFKQYKLKHINGALRNYDKKNPRAFYKAIRKYGPETFKWEILFQDNCHSNKLSDLEIFFIGYFDSQRYGYNMTPGGDGGATWTKKNISKERRIAHGQKIAKIRKERGTASRNQNRTNAEYKRIGRKISKSLRINKSMLGENNPMYGNGHRISGHKHGKAKRYLLIAPNRQLIGVFGTLKRICQKYRLNYMKMFYSIDQGIIMNCRYKNNLTLMNCLNWEIRSI